MDKAERKQTMEEEENKEEAPTPISIVLNKSWSRELCIDGVDEKKVQSWICSICSDISYPAIETPCGHLFCEPCIRHHLQTSLRCPMDQLSLLPSQLRASEFTRREIANLSVKCPFSDKGCGWKGNLFQIDAHLMNSAPFVPPSRSFWQRSSSVPFQPQIKSPAHFKGPYCECISQKCPHCGTAIRMDEYKTHCEERCTQRPIMCECGQSTAKDALEMHKKTGCLQRMITCTNGCSNVRQLDLSKHLRESCPLRVQDCPMSEVCDACPLLVESNVAKHMQDPDSNAKHLVALMRYVTMTTQSKKIDTEHLEKGQMVRVSPKALYRKWLGLMASKHALAVQFKSIWTGSEWPLAIVLKVTGDRYQVLLTQDKLNEVPIWMDLKDLKQL